MGAVPVVPVRLDFETAERNADPVPAVLESALEPGTADRPAAGAVQCLVPELRLRVDSPGADAREAAAVPVM